MRPDLIIETLIALVVGSVGWNIRIMLNAFSENMKSVSDNLTEINSTLISHISDYSIHKGD